ncbi:Homeobox protein cut-like 1 [Orchesella cincta]|uniref:Homeobox protein cut-like 1 n=1 Tax=Orchesella cincta TaxID=48709 RepID=A0A1D2ND39_ORCCI|nr:Homeobox protein cut-like 1 [Orchesella cincta]
MIILVEDIQRLQTSLNQIRENSATQIRLLEEQLNQKQEVISRLEARLDAQRDYDEMKRELVNLKASAASTLTTNTDSPSSSINGVDAKDMKDNNTITSGNSKRPGTKKPTQPHNIKIYNTIL